MFNALGTKRSSKAALAALITLSLGSAQQAAADEVDNKPQAIKPEVESQPTKAEKPEKAQSPAKPAKTALPMRPQKAQMAAKPQHR